MLKRKMLFAERMMYSDGVSPFNGLFPVKIKGMLTTARIGHALKRLQKKHPILSTAIATDARGMPWFVPAVPDAEIPVRIITRRTEQDWEQEAVREWNTAFDVQNGPLIRFVWIRSDTVSELLMVFHHCMCDGGSAVALLQEFLLLLDKPDTDIGREQLFTCIADVVPEAILKSRRRILKARLASGVGRLFLNMAPLKKVAKERKQDYLLHWKLDETTTASLIRKSKALGVTVNTLISLCLLSAFKQVRGPDAFNKITCPVEIRKYAPQIKKDSMFAFGLMLILSIDKNPGLDFAAKAAKMQALAEKRSLKLSAYDSLMMFEYAHALLPRMIDFLKYGKSTNDCMFSNMGVLDIPDQYDSFTVDTIYSPSVIGPLGNPTTLIVSTFKKQLDFSFVSSEGYIPYKEAQAIKESMMALLTQDYSIQ